MTSDERKADRYCQLLVHWPWILTCDGKFHSGRTLKLSSEFDRAKNLCPVLPLSALQGCTFNRTALSWWQSLFPTDHISLRLDLQDNVEFHRRSLSNRDTTHPNHIGVFHNRAHHHRSALSVNYSFSWWIAIRVSLRMFDRRVIDIRSSFRMILDENIDRSIHLFHLDLGERVNIVLVVRKWISIAEQECSHWFYSISVHWKCVVVPHSVHIRSCHSLESSWSVASAVDNNREIEDELNRRIQCRDHHLCVEERFDFPREKNRRGAEEKWVESS